MSNAIATKEETAVQLAPAASESAAVIQMIERVALNPNADITKLMQLLEMRERIEAASAKKAFFAALSAAQAEMKPVARTADNDQTKSKYATLEAIADAITPIQTKYGFGLTYDTADCPIAGHYRIVAELSHEAGFAKTYHADIPIDGTGMKGNANKTATHAFGSTISYGRRYLKLMIFDIATKRDDDDGNAAGRTDREFLSELQLTAIRSALKASGASEEKLLEHLNLPQLEGIFADKFDAVMSIIKARSEKAKAKDGQHG